MCTLSKIKNCRSKVWRGVPRPPWHPCTKMFSRHSRLVQVNVFSYCQVWRVPQWEVLLLLHCMGGFWPYATEPEDSSYDAPLEVPVCVSTMMSWQVWMPVFHLLSPLYNHFDPHCQLQQWIGSNCSVDGLSTVTLAPTWTHSYTFIAAPQIAVYQSLSKLLLISLLDFFLLVFLGH